MLSIAAKAEPANFDRKVRQKGVKTLKKYPNPTEKQWKSNSHWKNCKNELREAFGNVCCYSCHWVPHDTGSYTCDHFQDKKSFPALAYEWTNLRFVCGTLNGRKQNEVVLDPVGMPNDRLFLDFPSLLIKPFDSLDDRDYDFVLHTINVLGLNDDGTCLKSRLEYVMDYCNQHISRQFLETHAPFIAYELTRQGKWDQIRDIMLI